MTAHEEARATTSLVVYEPPAVLNVQQAERRYELPRTGAVAVRQAWGTGDTGAAQWPAGVELAKLIDSEGPERWRGKRVLEISAGGGAVVAIALMRAGAVVVATDADAEALKLHTENARANVEPDVFASRYRGALVLRWGDDPTEAISVLGPPDAVVASDVTPGGCLLMGQELKTGAGIWGAGIAAEQRGHVLENIATVAGTLEPPLDGMPPAH